VADKRYLNKVSQEKEGVLRTSFWAECQKIMQQWRKNASRRCETDADVRVFQGELRAYDKILELPDRVIEILEKKADKRE